MRHLLFLFILILGLTPVLTAQVAPSANEKVTSYQGAEAPLLISPAILQPSVFFNKQGVQQRGYRKWWRKDATEPLPDVEFARQTKAPNLEQGTKVTTSALLYPQTFNIPPVTPLWKRQSTLHADR